MKVNHSNAEGVQKSASRQAESAGRAKETRRTSRGSEAKSARPSGGVAGVKTEVSARARELSKAKAAASGAPDVREEKIAKLKELIDSGEYKMPSNEEIASRLVEEHMKSSDLE